MTNFFFKAYIYTFCQKFLLQTYKCQKFKYMQENVAKYMFP